MSPKHLMDEVLSRAPQHYRDFVNKEKKIEPPDYDRGIPGVVDKRSGEPISINFNEETRMGIFAPSGNGKTLLAKSFLSRAWVNGYKLFHGSDVKNDFQKVDKYGGASKDLIDQTSGLLLGESPLEMERTLGIPSFLVKKYSSQPDVYSTRFAVGFEDITMKDFKYLFRYAGLSDARQREMKNILTDIDDISKQNYSTIRDKIEEIDKKRIREPLLQHLDSLKKEGLLKSGVRSGMDLLQDLNDKRCVSLGFKHWRKAEMFKVRFYSAIMLRNLVFMLEEGLVEGPMIVFEDEFHKLSPNGEDSPVKSEFQDILDLSGRQNQISTCVSAQRPSQIPWTYSDDQYDFLGTLNKIFIGWNLPSSDWKKVIKSTPLWQQHHSDKWEDKMRMLEKYDFLYIDLEKHHSVRDTQIVRSLSPLCWHPTK